MCDHSRMKTCSSCTEEKPFEAYNRNAAKKDGLQAYCRDCNSIKLKAHYAQNKDKAVARSGRNRVIWKAKLHAYLADYFRQHPCVDCGESNLLLLTFDHLGNKEADVATLVGRGCSLRRIEREIAKCQVVCVRCHTFRTADQRGWWRMAYLTEDELAEMSRRECTETVKGVPTGQMASGRK